MLSRVTPRVTPPGYPFEDRDYQLYRDLFRRSCEAARLRIWAYCLMPNHVHLIGVPECTTSMAQAVGRANADYARHYNLQQRTCGHVWQARYFSSPLDNTHLWQAMTWYTMKARSGTVGANGVAKAVRALKEAVPNIRLHLVGHSLGGLLMAACAKTLCDDPKLQPASFTLLEAAFSHYGFSSNNAQNTPGFFRAVLHQELVKGPFVSTFSAQDTVVGTIYAIASRLADQNVEAIGDASDMFGGIGRNGAQKTAEAVLQPLHAVGKPYTFQAGQILCLDGSGGLIKDHGDVRNPVVTWAFVSAAAQTVKEQTAIASAQAVH